MQVRQSGRPVRQALDRHGPEHRLQRAGVSGLDPTARHPLITDNRVETLLTDGPQRQMIIQQPAQQLPPVTADALLQPGVIQASRVGPVKEPDQRLELLTTRSKPIRHSQLPTLTAWVTVRSDCTITTTAPERQDFTHRRVNFTSTGVEIGGHVRPPPWSTKDINNADFDTLFMTPRPRPAAATTRPSDPAEELNTPPAPAQQR